MRERRGEMRRGLAMSKEGHCVLGRLRREAQHGRAVPRTVCMVNEALHGHVAVAPAECFQNERMQVLPDRLRETLVHRAPRQLVAERKGAVGERDHASSETFLEGGRRERHGLLQQPFLGLAGNHGNQVRDVPRGSRQAGDSDDDGVAHRPRNSLLRYREGFGDKERIAAGDSMQLRGLPSRLLCQCRHGGFAQGRERQAPQREIAQHRAQRMTRAHLVIATGQHQQHAQALQAAPEKLDQVERGVIGPMNILEDDDRRPRPAGELIQSRIEYEIPLRRSSERGMKLLARLACNVIKRSQGMGCEQRFAATPQHTRRVPPCELAQQGGLADAGLAAHECDSPACAARDPSERHAQSLDEQLAFQQFHGGRQITGNRRRWQRRTQK